MQVVVSGIHGLEHDQAREQQCPMHRLAWRTGMHPVIDLDHPRLHIAE